LEGKREEDKFKKEVCGEWLRIIKKRLRYKARQYVKIKRNV